MKLSLSSNTSWVKPGDNIKQFSPILDQLENKTFCNLYTVESGLSKDIVTVKGKNDYIQLYYYIIPGKFAKIPTNTLALSFSFFNESYSLIHLLYKEGVIEHLGFALHPRTKTSGIFYFGRIPDENLTENNLHYSSNCKVIANQQYWSCNLKYILFNNSKYNQYENTALSYFDLAIDNINIPNEFMYYLKDYILKDAFIKKACIIVTLSFEISLQCSKDDLDNFPSISFVFDSTIIVFYKEELFKCYINLCFFHLKVKPNQNNTWIFGTSFYSNYSTYFDYEMGKITFYSKTPFQNTIFTIVSNTKITTLLNLNIYIVILDIFLLFIVKILAQWKPYR